MPALVRDISFDYSTGRVSKVKGRIAGKVFSYDEPVSREVIIYRRHDQLEIKRTFSDPTTGQFEFILPDNSNVYYRVVVVAGNSTENSQIQDFINVVL